MVGTRNVAVLGGSWSSNVGNAFFNIGAEWLIRSICGNAWFVPESPRWKQSVEQDFDLVGNLDCELILLTGPCLNLKLRGVYSRSFRKLYDRGVRVGYLSCGMSLYDSGEAHAVGEFLREFPPAFIATRDDLTARLIGPHVACPVHSGLCTSFFLNDACIPVPIQAEPYVVFNFDGDEPELRVDERGVARISPSPRRSVFSRRKSGYCAEINGMNVVRTSNMSMDEGYALIYQRPNTYHSDLPWGYLSVLQNAKCVYSERVHTCAATLICGGRAQFIAKSRRSFEKRSLLFEQAGLADILERPVQIDFDVLNPRKEQMKEFLTGALG